MSRPIYHLCRQRDWRTVRETGRYVGSAQDIVNGSIRFFTAEQLRGGIPLYLAGRRDLFLLTVDPDKAGDALRWEESATGERLLRLSGPLPLDAVLRADDATLDVEGRHQFPDVSPASEDD